MKQLKMVSFLFCILISCNPKTNSTPNQEVKNSSNKKLSNEVEQKMWNGIISKAEVTSYQYGSHELTGNSLDGNPDNVGKTTLYALTSAKINIDKWIGKNVIITGNYINGYPLENGPKLIEVIDIELDKTISINNN